MNLSRKPFSDNWVHVRLHKYIFSTGTKTTVLHWTSATCFVRYSFQRSLDVQNSYSLFNRLFSKCSRFGKYLWLFTSIFLSTLILFFNRSAANDRRIPCHTWVRKIKPVGIGNGIMSDVSSGQVVSFKQSTRCKNTGNSPTYQHGDQNLRWNRQ